MSFVHDIWYFAGLTTDIKPGKLIRRVIAGNPITLGRHLNGTLFALRDICPHRAAPLSAGAIVEDTVECPYHGWRFGADGVCKHMPSLTGAEPYDPAKVKVRRYPVHEANGAIYVFVSDNPRFDGEPDVPAPDFGPLPDRPK